MVSRTAYSLAALWVLVGTAVVARAQSGSLQIAEDEMHNYVSEVFQAYNSCDIAWFQGQFSPAAGIQMIYASGEVRNFTSNDYIATLRAVCRPYQFVTWDRTGIQVTTSGLQASAEWKMGWGGRQGLALKGSSALIFTNRLQVVREGRALSITSLEAQADELIEGPEQAYWRQASRGGLLDVAIRFYHEIIIRMRDWRLKYREKGSLF